MLIANEADTVTSSRLCLQDSVKKFTPKICHSRMPSHLCIKAWVIAALFGMRRGLAAKITSFTPGYVHLYINDLKSISVQWCGQ